MSNLPIELEQRILRLVVIVQWLALAIGIVAGVVSFRASATSLAAVALGSAYVVTVAAFPRAYLRRSFVVETLSMVGSLTTMSAMALTGLTESPYLLLSITPPIFATLLGGLRVGMATALLSAGLLTVIGLTPETGPPRWGPLAGFSGLYVVMAVVMAQIQRLLAEIHGRASELETSSQERERRLAHLERTHDLLDRLAALIADTDLSAVDLGRAALETLVAAYPGSGAIAALEGEQGSSVIARAGTPPPEAVTSVISLRVGGRRVGRVELSMERMLDDESSRSIEASLRPLAIALANLQLIDSIAHEAVKRERVRLARDLHDEIGPSLASMGLALDMALLEPPGEEGVTLHLEQLRGNVQRLVDEVRATVADLRSAQTPSLTTQVTRLVSGLGAGPAVEVQLDERRPPRPSLSSEVGAMVGEAIRNAWRHADARLIRVTGWVDFDRGRVVVEDDGGGFDPANVPDGHYGILGMRERAQALGVRLDVRSGPGGTQVSVDWGNGS